MIIKIFGILFVIILFVGCGTTSKNGASKEGVSSILKLEMKLSAFGVESDDFPSIEAKIDFMKKSSSCKKSYYHPSYKDSVYSLTEKEMIEVLEILADLDLKEMKKDYTVNFADVNITDQPSSTMTIYTMDGTYIVHDYGLKASKPLKTIYKIIYKL
jgi:hypothetical protein